jgi:hypothetical protein
MAKQPITFFLSTKAIAKFRYCFMQVCALTFDRQDGAPKAKCVLDRKNPQPPNTRYMKTLKQTLTTISIVLVIAVNAAFAQAGNSAEAMACQKECLALWEGTDEKIAFEKTKNSVTTFQQRYAILANKKLIDVTLNKCKANFPANEYDDLKKASKDLETQFYTMGGCDGMTEFVCEEVVKKFPAY